MIKYIYNTEGEYVAFLLNNKYCFSSEMDHIGFMKGIDLYDYNGKYLGTLTSDDRIIKNKNKNYSKIIPISKPSKPFTPLRPLKRYRMSALGSSYIDIFSSKEELFDYKKFDKKYNKFLNCKLYSYNNKFLGVLSTNKYDSDSLANQYGIYGSPYSADSIFNKYGTYGSEYNQLSPFNQYSSQPAVLKNNIGQTVAKVSNNSYLGNNVINATELFNWYKAKVK